MNKKGLLYIISAPSGAGKTTLVKALVNSTPNLVVSISHTTRPKRPQEENDVNYHFVDIEQFNKLLAKDAFLEYANVFGNFYGTSQLWVEQQLIQGNDVILEIDWQGARIVRQKMPDAVSIFILPPSKKTLDERLKGRGQDDPAIIKHRMERAQEELSHYPEYDYLVVNDNFDHAVEDLKAIVQANRLRTPLQSLQLVDLLSQLTV